jgi:hypothetical protein
MHILRWCSPLSFNRLSWTADTFHDSDQAELALCRNRPNFLRRDDIVKIIPSAIAKRIYHPGDIAQIAGFQELFVHLNTNPDAEELRRLIVNYFNASFDLRCYLSK